MQRVPQPRQHSWRRHWHAVLVRQLHDAGFYEDDVYVTPGLAAPCGTAGQETAPAHDIPPTTPAEELP